MPCDNRSVRWGRVLEQIRDELHLLGQELRDQRTEMREEFHALGQELRDQRTETRDILRINAEVNRRHELAFRDMAAALQGLREDSRAHTRAILLVLDRLEGNGAAPAIG